MKKGQRYLWDWDNSQLLKGFAFWKTKTIIEVVSASSCILKSVVSGDYPYPVNSKILLGQDRFLNPFSIETFTLLHNQNAMDANK